MLVPLMVVPCTRPPAVFTWPRLTPLAASPMMAAATPNLTLLARIACLP
jgi:hypothetical protein